MEWCKLQPRQIVLVQPTLVFFTLLYINPIIHIPTQNLILIGLLELIIEQFTSK